MPTEKQIRALLVICIVTSLISSYRIYSGRQTAPQTPDSHTPSYVYEIRGIEGSEGFYFFDDEMTLGEIMAYKGIPVFVSDIDRHTFIRQGSRIVVNESLVSVENMDARALLNFFLPIPLNTASAHDLTAIPGVGIKTAEAIIELRNRKKRIDDLSCLLEIRGIGEKRLNLIKPYITLD